MVEPEVLHSVANRLDELAADPPVDSLRLRRCLTDLEDAWSGGVAADLAAGTLRRLIALSEHPILMHYDDSGDGRLIVAFGDPTTSRNVATYVPGAGSSLASVGDELERARMLRERAGPDTSVIMWLGYDAPDFADAMFEKAARQGAEPLRQFQADLVANHEGEIGQMTVIGHSYGSVVIGVAEREGELAADDIVALGSPGMGVREASQLRDPTEVWATTASNDPVRRAPDFILGRDPDEPRFGARTFASAAFGHGGYFHPDNPALATLAQIANGTHMP